MQINNRNPIKDSSYDEAPSIESHTHSNPHSRNSNRYCQQYSFNRHEQIEGKRQIYLPGAQESSHYHNPDLIRKYSSLFNELQQIQSTEVIHLLLEEIEQNEKGRIYISQIQRQKCEFQEEIIELRCLLIKKRQVIYQLCQNESNTLNMLECLQKAGQCTTINWDSHFLYKYKELESHMNQYIANTNQAQQEFAQKLRLAKTQGQRLLSINDQLLRQKFLLTKQLQVFRLKTSKNEEKEHTIQIQLQNLQEENTSLRQEIQEMKKIECREAELLRENRELSNELDFIREKVNENQSLSRDIFDKVEEHSELAIKLGKEKEELQGKLEELRDQMRRGEEDRRELALKIETLLQEAGRLREGSDKLVGLVEEREDEVAGLRDALRLAQGEAQELLVAWQEERASKQAIKDQLIQLASQVKSMQQTYKKQLNQNEKIKEQLHRFWQRNTPAPTHSLQQISLNSSSQSIKKSFIKNNSLQQSMY